MNKLMKLNQKCNNDLELIKAKYEKKNSSFKFK